MGRVLVIAEIGACHEGRLERAIALIWAAKDAGADVAKGQFWSSADRLADRRNANSYREIYRKYQLIPEWLPALKAACDRAGIEWACTCYLPEDVAIVAPFVKRFKVSSFEAQDEAFLRAHLPFVLAGKDLIVSCGMNARTTDIGNAFWTDHFVDFLRYHDRLKFLHCVSSYPAPVEALNLHLLRPDPGLRSSYHGFSDHSDPALTWTGAIATAAGAEIIEAHLKLDDTDPENPDAPHAMTPRQFEDYVRHIRFAETCLGDGEKKLQACEEPMAKFRVKGN